MAMYYFVGEILECRRRGYKKYLKNFWNIVDLVILLVSQKSIFSGLASTEFFSLLQLVILSFSYNIFHPIYLHYYLKHATALPMEYHSLDVICWLNSHYMNLVAVLAFLVWIKIFQFFTFNKTSIQLNATFVKVSMKMHV